MIALRLSLRINLVTMALSILVVAGAIPKLVISQNCGCSDSACCSRYGYCGYSEDYCGWPGCQEGPCDPAPTPNNVSVGDLVPACVTQTNVIYCQNSFHFNIRRSNCLTIFQVYLTEGMLQIISIYIKYQFHSKIFTTFLSFLSLLFKSEFMKNHKIFCP